MPPAKSSFHYLAASAVLPGAGWVAWSLGDARGAGVLCGATVALAISLAGWLAQERALRRGGVGANQAMTAFALAFLVKLFAVAIGAVALRMHEGLAALVDWRAYLLGFAGAVAWILFVGAFRRFGAARTPKEAPASC